MLRSLHYEIRFAIDAPEGANFLNPGQGEEIPMLPGGELDSKRAA